MELSNILELIHAVSDSNLTEFNLQDGNLNISMSTEKTIVQQVAASADTASFAAGYQPTVQPTLQAAAQNQKDTDRADDTQKLTGNIVKSPLVGTYYAASSLENSGISSRKSTPLCASVISPGRGLRPPPAIACGVLVWWGLLNGLSFIKGFSLDKSPAIL